MSDQIKSTLDDQGHEVPSDVPMAIPVGFKIPETLNEQVARLVRHHRFAEALGQPDDETFEEADDFDVGEDFDPSSPYEQVFDPIINRSVSIAEFVENSAEYKKLYEAAAEEFIPDPPGAARAPRDILEGVDPPKSDEKPKEDDKTQ